MARGDNKDTMGTQGVDWEWRTAKGTNVKTRHRFTAAERAAMAPKPAAKPKATTSTKSAPAAKVYSGRGDAPYSRSPKDAKADRVVAKTPNAPKAERPISPTRSKTATGRYSEYEAARLGNITEANYDKLTPAQREAKGLPVSWIDYVRSGGDSAVKAAPAAKVAAKRPRRPDQRNNALGMYAKGGMVTKKGKC